jgi:glycerol-3-phosphate acyltransferase PlsY
MLKGFGPTLGARLWLMNLGASDDRATMVGVFCAAAAVLGHTYTFWLGFKGGKGVATSAGGMLGLSPWALLVALVAWIIVFATTRYVALASIVASVVLPVAMAIIMTAEHKWNYVILGLGIVLGVLVIVRHRANIARMISGTENRFARKESKETK